jgi:hypothetical protein
LIGEREFSYTINEEMKIPVINGTGTTYTGGGSLTATPASVKSNNNSGKDSKSNDDKKTIEDLKEEKDRYADINEALDDMSTKLERVRKAKDRAFGKDKIAAMQNEREVLEQEVATLKEKHK